jgi:hypothetical protein
VFKATTFRNVFVICSLTNKQQIKFLISFLQGRFWSVDQQAHLFPAQISDDSPWKQEAISRLDPEAENQTQEAIDLYFSRHSHQVHSCNFL